MTEQDGKARELIDQMMAPSKRLDEALAALDDRAAMALKVHAAISREVDLALSAAVPRPERLGTVPLQHKIAMLAALTDLDDNIVDHWTKPIRAFIGVRNAVAHPEGKTSVDQAMQALEKALDGIDLGDDPLRAAGAYVVQAIHMLSGPKSPIGRALLEHGITAKGKPGA